MSGNTTVVLRPEPGLSRSETDAHEQELRRLLVCGTIHEARVYAEDHGCLVVLGRMAQREGTAFVELARAALRYPAIIAELRDAVRGAPTDECAASRIDSLFFMLVRKECDFGLQRLIMEMLRAWASGGFGSREKFVSDKLFQVLQDISRANAEHIEDGRRARAQWKPRSLAEEVCTRLYHPDLGAPDFINWMGDQPHDDYELIMDLVRESAKPTHGCAARAQEILRHLEP